MAAVRYSKQAIRDFDGIIARLEQVAGQNIAASYANDIGESTDQLVVNPGIGAPRGKLGRGIRMLVVSPYLIFYEGGPKAKSVTVLRIIDGRRRITRRTIAAGRDASDK